MQISKRIAKMQVRDFSDAPSRLQRANQEVYSHLLAVLASDWGREYSREEMTRELREQGFARQDVAESVTIAYGYKS
jgi:hypothetical protein